MGFGVALAMAQVRGGTEEAWSVVACVQLPTTTTEAKLDRHPCTALPPRR